jgi:hypothetical protein
MRKKLDGFSVVVDGGGVVRMKAVISERGRGGSADRRRQLVCT